MRFSPCTSNAVGLGLWRIVRPSCMIPSASARKRDNRSVCRLKLEASPVPHGEPVRNGRPLGVPPGPSLQWDGLVWCFMSWWRLRCLML